MDSREVKLSEVPAITRDSKYDDMIDQALKMQQDKALIVEGVPKDKMDNLTVALSGRIKSRKVNEQLRVRHIKDAVYIVRRK